MKDLGRGSKSSQTQSKEGKKNTAVTIPLGQMPPAGKHTQRYNALGSGGGRRSCFPVRSGPSAWGTDQPTQLALPHTALLTRLCCHTHVKYSKLLTNATQKAREGVKPGTCSPARGALEDLSSMGTNPIARAPAGKGETQTQDMK